MFYGDCFGYKRQIRSYSLTQDAEAGIFSVIQVAIMVLGQSIKSYFIGNAN